MGLAMAPVYTTVIGQCMGAADIDAANFYFKKLNKITLLLSVLWNALVFAVTPADRGAVRLFHRKQRSW